MEEKHSLLHSFLGLITFSTVIPLRVHTTLENMTRLTWLWPFVHLFIGFLGALIGYLCLDILNFSSLLSGAIVYAFFLIITGFNHIDGLMDMADAVMVHGDSAKKLRVMKDSIVGTGGITTFFIVALITVLTITNLLEFNFIVGIIIAEVASKISLLTTCICSASKNEGIGMHFIKSMNLINYSISIIIFIAISYVIGGFAGIIGILGGVFAGALIALIAKYNFNVATGDVLGASNEFGRMISLLAMVILFGVVL
ncbi:adenosylcobinamide-GDP ribazoletransferase [Methanobrevibacter sp. OttesenSCG-928-K11]|nr:adenosylcobinamide-GDP ribazoletransferase [Methanobrevibacter sp. OttesenSCG-928-K11]MDL2270214.1 adenosylcobinamide-GDP ribazoletransferase [Methanobrevibacter sp. OttesenSCG-928-I08]